MAWRYQAMRQSSRVISQTDPLELLLGAELIDQHVPTVINFGERDVELARDVVVILLREGGAQDLCEPSVRVK